MDEKKLAELLKDAVAETPPPTFGASDVARESDRQRVRHRNGVLAGSAFGVALLAGATALGVALWTGSDAATDAANAESVASGSNGNAAPYELPDEDNKAAAPTERGGTARRPSSSADLVATESPTSPPWWGVSGNSSTKRSRRHGRRDSSITARTSVLRT